MKLAEIAADVDKYNARCKKFNNEKNGVYATTFIKNILLQFIIKMAWR